MRPSSTCFFNSLTKALDDALGLRIADLGQALADAEVLAFDLEMIGGALTPVIAAQGQPRGDALGSAAVMLPEPLLDGLHGVEAIADLAGRDTHAPGVSVLDGTENPDGGFLHHLGRGPILAPELVGLLGGDGSIVGIGLALRRPRSTAQLEPLGHLWHSRWDAFP